MYYCEIRSDAFHYVVVVVVVVYSLRFLHLASPCLPGDAHSSLAAPFTWHTTLNQKVGHGHMHACMHTCSYIRMYVCIICTYTISMCMLRTYCMYVCAYVCTYICMYCVYVRMYCVYACTVCMHAYIRIYVRRYVCMLFSVSEIASFAYIRNTPISHSPVCSIVHQSLKGFVYS